MLRLRGGLPSWSLRQLKNLMFSMAGFRTDTQAGSLALRGRPTRFGFSGGRPRRLVRVPVLAQTYGAADLGRGSWRAMNRAHAHKPIQGSKSRSEILLPASAVA